MNKYKLNFLRQLTGGELQDSILKTVTNIKIEDNKFSFKIRANININNWNFIYGSSK